MGTRKTDNTNNNFPGPWMNFESPQQSWGSEDMLPRNQQRPHTSPTGSTATEMKISVLLSLWQQLLAKQPLQTVWFHTEMVGVFGLFFHFAHFIVLVRRRCLQTPPPLSPNSCPSHPPSLFWLSGLLLKEIKAIKSTSWIIWGDLLSKNM